MTMAFFQAKDITMTFGGLTAVNKVNFNIEKGMNEFGVEVATLAQQKKIELRDEMSKELASKADVPVAGSLWTVKSSG